MATKKASKGKSLDNRKLQEIIGRALTDEKFVKDLVRAPKKALAEYELDAKTTALVAQGIQLVQASEGLAAQFRDGYGIEVQSV